MIKLQPKITTTLAMKIPMKLLMAIKIHADQDDNADENETTTTM